MMTTVEIRHWHMFAGLGGGARGFNRGEARVGQLITDLDDARLGVGYRGLERIGKKAAGRLLDGRTHDGFPGSPS